MLFVFDFFLQLWQSLSWTGVLGLVYRPRSIARAWELVRSLEIAIRNLMFSKTLRYGFCAKSCFNDIICPQYRISICVLYGSAPFVYKILLHFKLADVSEASINTSYVNIIYFWTSLAHSLSNLRTLVCVSETVGYTPVLLIENSAYGTTDWRNSAMIYGTIHLGEPVHIRHSQWNLMWLLWPLICSAYITRTLDLNRVNQIYRNPTLQVVKLIKIYFRCQRLYIFCGPLCAKDRFTCLITEVMVVTEKNILAGLLYSSYNDT